MPGCRRARCWRIGSCAWGSVMGWKWPTICGATGVLATVQPRSPVQRQPWHIWCVEHLRGVSGGKSHWFCALQVTLAANVCHRARSLYALTAGIAQSFVRDKGFPSLSCFLHTCKWLDISLTSGCLVPPFPNCVEDFFSCLQPPRPTLGSWQSIPFHSLPFSVCTSCSLQQPLQTQPLLRLEK